MLNRNGKSKDETGRKIILQHGRNAWTKAKVDNESKPPKGRKPKLLRRAQNSQNLMMTKSRGERKKIHNGNTAMETKEMEKLAKELRVSPNESKEKTDGDKKTRKQGRPMSKRSLQGSRKDKNRPKKNRRKSPYERNLRQKEDARMSTGKEPLTSIFSKKRKSMSGETKT